MPKCKKGNSTFEIPKFAIEPVFVLYCKDSISKAMKKTAKIPLIDYMNLTAKNIKK